MDHLTPQEFCVLLDIPYSSDKLFSTRKDGLPILSGNIDLKQVAYLVCFYQWDTLFYLEMLSKATKDYDPVIDLSVASAQDKHWVNLLESEGILHIDKEGKTARIVWGIGPHKRWQ